MRFLLFLVIITWGYVFYTSGLFEYTAYRAASVEMPLVERRAWDRRLVEEGERHGLNPRLLKKRLKLVKIRLVPFLTEGKIGLYYPDTKTIFFSKREWAEYSDVRKEMLYFHEVGHFLGLEHCSFEDQVMSAYITTEDRYNRDSALEFFFKVVSQANPQLIARPRSD